MTHAWSGGRRSPALARPFGGSARGQDAPRPKPLPPAYLPKAGPPAPSSKWIAAQVAAAWSLRVEDLLGPGRARRVAHPRQELMWRLRHTRSMSFPQIGAFIGGRDHTTVIHGVRAFERRLAEAQS